MLPVAWALLGVLVCCAQQCETAVRGEPQLYTYEVVAEYPHDPHAFTQGAARCCCEGTVCLIDRSQTRARSAAAAGDLRSLNPLPLAGLEFDDVCDDDGENCRDIFWESTGAR